MATLTRPNYLTDHTAVRFARIGPDGLVHYDLGVPRGASGTVTRARTVVQPATSTLGRLPEWRHNPTADGRLCRDALGGDVDALARALNVIHIEVVDHDLLQYHANVKGTDRDGTVAGCAMPIHGPDGRSWSIYIAADSPYGRLDTALHELGHIRAIEAARLWDEDSADEWAEGWLGREPRTVAARQPAAPAFVPTWFRM